MFMHQRGAVALAHIIKYRLRTRKMANWIAISGGENVRRLLAGLNAAAVMYSQYFVANGNIASCYAVNGDAGVIPRTGRIISFAISHHKVGRQREGGLGAGHPHRPGTLIY